MTKILGEWMLDLIGLALGMIFTVLCVFSLGLLFIIGLFRGSRCL